MNKSKYNNKMGDNLMNLLDEKDQQKLNYLFNEGGYVPLIASNDDKFGKVFCDLDIDITKYRPSIGSWLSKGRAMKEFWENGTDDELCKMLHFLNKKY